MPRKRRRRRHPVSRLPRVGGNARFPLPPPLDRTPASRWTTRKNQYPRHLRIRFRVLQVNQAVTGRRAFESLVAFAVVRPPSSPRRLTSLVLTAFILSVTRVGLGLGWTLYTIIIWPVQVVLTLVTGGWAWLCTSPSLARHDVQGANHSRPCSFSQTATCQNP